MRADLHHFVLNVVIDENLSKFLKLSLCLLTLCGGELPCWAWFFGTESGVSMIGYTVH